MKINTLKVLLGLGRHTKYNISKLSNSSSAKNHQFWKQYDEFLDTNKWLMKIEYSEMVPQNWRYYYKRSPNESLPINLYLELWKKFPIPIPYPLFFCYQKESDNKEMEKKIGELADKWLKDILSGGSFYQLNKEYFTRAEVKQFLACDWLEFFDEQCVYPASYLDLADLYFYAKIKANNLALPNHIFADTFELSFTHKIVQEYFQFICNNREHFKDKNEVKRICEYLKSEYIDTGNDFDFSELSWQDLKRLHNEWDILSTLKYKFGHYFTHKIVKEYFKFICNSLNNIRNKNEISDFSDFLKNKYIATGKDFDFNGISWKDLKRLSDEWHMSLRLKKERGLQKKLDTRWNKSTVKDFIYREKGETWTIKEITSGKLLYDEGEDMDHCVFSYLQDCITGKCFIFSVSSMAENDTDEKRIATVEVSEDLKLRQVSGRYNSFVNEKTKIVIMQWADENKINSTGYIFDTRNEVEQYHNELEQQNDHYVINNDLLDAHYDFDEKYFENIDNEAVDIYGKIWTINSLKGNRKFWYYANKYGPAYYTISYEKGKEIILSMSYMNEENLIILVSSNGYNSEIFKPDGSSIDYNIEYYCILRWLVKKGVRLDKFPYYGYEYYDDDYHDGFYFEGELDFPYKIE
jgi:dephospho-CoA kinase